MIEYKINQNEIKDLKFDGNVKTLAAEAIGLIDMMFQDISRQDLESAKLFSEIVTKCTREGGVLWDPRRRQRS